MSVTLPDPTISHWLAVHVAEFAMMSPDEIDPCVPFTEYGLDSVYAVSLCAEMHDELGLDVDPTVTISHPTVSSLASHLSGVGAGPGRWEE